MVASVVILLAVTDFSARAPILIQSPSLHERERYEHTLCESGKRHVPVMSGSAIQQSAG